MGRNYQKQDYYLKMENKFQELWNDTVDLKQDFEEYKELRRRMSQVSTKLRLIDRAVWRAEVIAAALSVFTAGMCMEDWIKKKQLPPKPKQDPCLEEARALHRFIYEHWEPSHRSSLITGVATAAPPPRYIFSDLQRKRRFGF